MSIDLSRFRQTFLDESREGLDAMESGLLRLEEGHHDSETLNAIFRAAHSIKGGAGTFGFSEIAGVTHLLETLLDQMRSGTRAVTPEGTAALLQSVDVLRGMLAAAQDNRANDAAQVAALTAALNAVLGAAVRPHPTAGSASGPPLSPQSGARDGGRPPAAAARARGWRIRFVPQAHLLKTGNEPGRIFRELERLGKLKVEADATHLPKLADCEPESSYLGWTLTLEGEASRDAVAELFAWVEGDCELAIEPLAPAASAAAAPAARVRESEGAERSTPESSIRVNVEKVDALINLVGELVITQAMLKQLSSVLDPVQNEKLLAGLGQLDRNTRDLQDAVMSVRMLPMDFVFSRFPRTVRDLAGKLNKKVRLRTVGEATELDKGVIEKITDPLNHLVRNSLDHGLETPEERVKAGKDETGTITLEAGHQGGHIVLRVSDDGRGLNREKILNKAQQQGIAIAPDAPDAEVWQLIFAPGFSTAEQVTDVSGRGVGMDVVRKNILALNGQIDIHSELGKGASVTIRLPLTLAILDGMSVSVGGEIFIMPLNSVVESLQPKHDDIKSISGQGRVIKVRNEFLPLVPLHDVFRVAGTHNDERIVVILEAEGKKLAVEVDELVGQQQVVIKNLESNYRRIRGISGATILGDGRVALIVDVGGLTRGVAKAA